MKSGIIIIRFAIIERYEKINRKIFLLRGEDIEVVQG
jgi:hypothetical protein